jgi:hypothetical protein
VIKGSKQYEGFKEFCRKRRYQPHKNLALFSTGADDGWILYRRGTKHSQWMKDENEFFPGWTFSKSKGNTKERELTRSVCLHCPAYEGAPKEEVWFFRKSSFERAVNAMKAKRIYIAKSRKREPFDPEVRKLLNERQTSPIYD